MAEKVWEDVVDRSIVILKQDLVSIDRNFPIEQVMPRTRLEERIPVDYPTGLEMTFRKDRMILTAKSYPSIPVLSVIESDVYDVHNGEIGDSRSTDIGSVEGGRRQCDQRAS